MHKVADWASYHSTDLVVLQDILQAYSANTLASRPWAWDERKLDQSQLSVSSIDTCLSEYISPAILAWFEHQSPMLIQSLADTKINFIPNGKSVPPSASWDSTNGRASISINWNAQPNDVMCLAHEVGHVIHYVLSDTDGMPPIARETCAFLSELIVLDHLSRTNVSAFHALQRVWEEENQSYLGRDVDNLKQALKDPTRAYEYRLNYPVARLAAVYLFNRYSEKKVRTKDAIVALFKGGEDAMDHVPLAALSYGADALTNYLPQFPCSEAAPLAAFQSLGAMALLEVASCRGASEQTIGAYYADLLGHLQRQTAFIGLHPDGRPIGYATWCSDNADSEITLTHQTAPFGDHLALQRLLQSRFEKQSKVIATAPRSARQEQVAW